LGAVVGWLIWGRDRSTQRERDWLEVPGLYPLLRRKYFIDDAADGVVALTMGPMARLVNWTNDYIIDGIVNGVAALTKALGNVVYNGLDQVGIDGIYNGISAFADNAGAALRKLQTGRVQQYAGGFVAGALILVVLFVWVV
jgi:NADH-quinone oxidoreductase subunit L